MPVDVSQKSLASARCSDLHGHAVLTVAGQRRIPTGFPWMSDELIQLWGYPTMAPDPKARRGSPLSGAALPSQAQSRCCRGVRGGSARAICQVLGLSAPFRRTFAPMGWMWVYQDSSGAPVDQLPEVAATEAFPTQADAETWFGESWRELLAGGVDAVTLFEDDRQVYGPMSLHPA